MPDIRLLAKKEKKMYKLILASQSPRRRELLKMLGIEFDIKVSNCEEIITSSEPGSGYDGTCKTKGFGSCK